MKNAFDSAKWIWSKPDAEIDEYAEFYEEFTWKNGKTEINISVDSDYTLFINGKFAASGQYGDFEHYKIYDTVDITSYLKEGENSVAILVWHFGCASSRYRPAKAGMIYEIICDGKVISESSEKTLARTSKAYLTGFKKFITGQLGLTYLYDSTKEDEWTVGNGADMTPAVTVNKQCTMYPRPIVKHDLLETKQGKLIKTKNSKYYLLDLGEETVGLFTFKFKSATAQKISLYYGEHIEDGGVRRHPGGRNFMFFYVAKEGENEYTNYMLRLGCRYLEVESEEPIELESAGVIPQVYPTKVKPFKAKDELDQRIYDVCVKTLELCMMEHYVDCPWREQCLYGFDSRNQMICGYTAFEDGNRDYARSNLLLMSKDTRDDRVMSICYPCGVDLTIPSFSLHYIIAVGEYTLHTGDITLVQECETKIRELLDTFIGNIKDGIAHRLTGRAHWAFYDWSDHSSGGEGGIPDLCLNSLLIMALDSYEKVCEKAGLVFPYKGISSSLRVNAYKAFYNRNKKLCSMTVGGEDFTELANSMAILAEVVTGDEARYICDKIVKNELIPCSLSNKITKFDALLKTDEKLYMDIILGEIRCDYKLMLDAGATSFWETIEGASAFGNAGSLCHGWSAIPILYLNRQ